MAGLRSAATLPVTQVQASAYVVPTERPEADGTLEWDHTTLVVVELTSGHHHGLGYTYAAPAAASLLNRTVAPLLKGRDAHQVGATMDFLLRKVRNLGQPGLVSMALSAVDLALWDLKARSLELPLFRLLPVHRSSAPAYGSGGFTSLTVAELTRQLGAFRDQGLGAVKMKVGSDPEQDVARVREARQHLGPAVTLMIDANGAYSLSQARSLAEQFAAFGVTWLEEPVSSDDLEGLKRLRDHAPSGMDIAAGEYGDRPLYFRRMLQAQAVDVLQLDVTRCLGLSGFLAAAALADAHQVPVSTHTAPAAHLPAALSAARFRHCEYFYDHVRIEQQLFDGAPALVEGQLHPDPSRPGLGLTFKRKDAAPFAV